MIRHSVESDWRQRAPPPRLSRSESERARSLNAIQWTWAKWEPSYENEYIVGKCVADGYYHLSNGLTIDGCQDSCLKRQTWAQ